MARAGAIAGPPQPPVLFRLGGHPLRWQLLIELARSDRRVRELVGALGRPQSLVSYHLRRLRAAGMVSAHRSSADGRDAYYRLELDRCRDLLAAAGIALHPGLGADPAPPRAAPGTGRARVLFLCTGNSARSQIAEALMHRLSDGMVDAASAGSRPKDLHPSAVRVLRRRGIDISANRSKHLDAFVQERFDRVVTLCDRVREVCPEFPGNPQTIHWSIPDPAAEAGGDDAFQRTAAELETRIRFLLPQLAGASG
jgi:protein-tyrosine-phosphatase